EEKTAEEIRKEHEHEKMVKTMKRMRRWRLIKLGITLIILIGVGVYFYWTYQAAKALQVTHQEIVGFELIGPTRYRVTFDVYFNNPTEHGIDVEEVSYEVYVEGAYLGEGYKRDLSIPPGEKKHTFTFTFDIRDAAESAKRAFLQETVLITVKGKATIPAKVFGLFTWKRFTVPYSVDKQVNIKKEVRDRVAEMLGELREKLPQAVRLYQPLQEDITKSSVKLTWSEYVDGNFSKYEVHGSKYRNFVPGSTTLIATIPSKTTTEFKVTEIPSSSELMPNTTYYFKIRVYNLQGYYADSNEINVTTLSLPANTPPTVTLLSPTNGALISNLTPQLSWKGEDIDGDPLTYDVYLDTSDATTMRAQDQTNTTYTTPELTVGETYYWKVIPHDGKVNGECVSGVWHFTVQMGAPNQPPVTSISSPSEGQIVSGVITINGTASDSDGSIQVIQVSINDPDFSSPLAVTGTTSWSAQWDSRGVADGTYQIYARASDDEGSWSLTVSVNVTVNNNPPTAVTLYPPTEITSSSVKLIWSQNGDGDFERYEVHVSTTPGFTPDSSTLRATIITQTTTSYTVEGLSSGTTYYFKIVVYDRGGRFATSNEVNATTFPL
ncbi:MAG: fibronectin type III domain-containing protein, partial [Candidatus Thermoplasmatota archaeon]